MKIFAVLLLALLLSPALVSAQQATKADLQQLRTEILAEIKALGSEIKALNIKVDEISKGLNLKIDEMDKRLSNQISEMENRLNIRISEMDKRLSNQISETDKRLSAKIETSEKIAGILVLVVLAAMALPQILGYFRDRRERKDLKRQRDIQESLQGQIDELRREIAELKTPKL